MNLADVLTIATERSPSAIAVTAGADERTYAELLDEVRAIAARLEESGVGRGDRVAMIAYNSIEFISIALAVAGVGAVLVPINTRTAGIELAGILEHSDARLLFADDELVERAETAVRDSGLSVPVWRTSTMRRPALLTEATPVAVTPHPFVAMDPDDDCYVLYTSGTTGAPKGVVRSHQSCLAAVQNYIPNVRTSENASGFLYVIPMASIGFVNSVCSAIFNGLRLEVMARFDVEDTIRLIDGGAISHVYLVPSMWAQVIEKAGTNPGTGRLAWALWGGEPMPTGLAERITDRFGNVLAGVWGSSEGGLTCGLPGSEMSKPGSAGSATGTNRVRIVDAVGNEVPRGSTGEIIFSGPAIFNRYLHNAEATRETLVDGWVHSGDLGRMDDDGDIWIVGRIKDLIISGGANIYPAEVEAALLRHPAVKEVAVVGAPDQKWGEKPVAFVVTSAETSAEELDEWFRGQLAAYKAPREWRFVTELPKNENGKIWKSALRDRLLREP